MGVRRVYKALVKTGDGKLVSIWAGTYAGRELEYEEGKITHNPEGGMGIFVTATIKEAKTAAFENGAARAGECGGQLKVYEATPIGKILSKKEINLYSEHDRYPAIRLEEEVWSSEAFHSMGFLHCFTYR